MAAVQRFPASQLVIGYRPPAPEAIIPLAAGSGATPLRPQPSIAGLATWLKNSDGFTVEMKDEYFTE